jgi:hypothetical protein
MSTKKHCKLGDANCADKVWEMGKIIDGKNPDLYRKDVYGRMIYRPYFGKDHSLGWTIDCIKPQQRGGSDDIRNLQPLNAKKEQLVGEKTKKKSRHSACNK